MKRLLFGFIVIFIFSCSVNKPLTSSTTASEISSLGYFEPVAFINYIEKGNKSAPSDSLSYITKYALDSLMFKYKSKFRLSNKLTFDNDTTRSIFKIETGRLAQKITQQRSLSGIKITPVIDSILEHNNTRFGLSVIATGFGRRKGNFGGQVAKGIGIGILTMGMATVVPIKSSLNLYTFIFDSKKDEVAYFKRQIPNRQIEPTDIKSIEEILLSTFEDYFYSKD